MQAVIEPTTELLPLRTISSHFQRSINVTYDMGNEAYIAGYIPTEAGVQALANVLRQVNKSEDTSTQRAHVFYAPYGSGKSLLSLVLGAFGKGRSDAIETVLDRATRQYAHLSDELEVCLDSEKRLLPIYLLGNEGSLHRALTRALTEAVIDAGLRDLRPHTHYQAAINTIKRWETQYPETSHRLSVALHEQDNSIEKLIEGLEFSLSAAFTQFEDVYAQLTAGARFDEHVGVKLGDIFHETVKGLREHGYDGVLIVWDEFGRFMEAKSSHVFGTEAAQLQDFAEFCNRSGENQVHLVLVTHRQLATYAGDLPDDYQKEWARIAERFWTHNVTSDPAITYRLLSEAIETVNSDAWELFLNEQDKELTALVQQTAAYDLFDNTDDLSIVEALLPLHPLTAYALPRLTRRVAQNERTLFTFLADDTSDVQAHLHTFDDWSLVGVDALWDYFAEGIRADKEVGGTQRTWSGVIHALGKISQDDLLSARLIKALGILQIIGDVNVQTNTVSGRIMPSTELLAWAVEADEENVQHALHALARRRVIAHNQTDGYWVFMRGSNVDLESEVAKLKVAQSPTPIQLQKLLQTEVETPTYLPRGYNLAKCMTRFFTTVYCWHDEVNRVGSDEYLKRLHPAYGYADGVVVFVLALNTADLNQAIETIEQLSPNRATFVVPDQPLLLTDAAEELFALRELQNDPQFMEQDSQLHGEIEFFIEDAKRRLERVLSPFFRPQLGQSRWYSNINGSWRSQQVRTSSHISRLLSDCCYDWFTATPTFNNETVNLHKPTKIQANAAERMIDLLLRRMPDNLYPADLGIKSGKPEHLIARTMLVQTGLLQQVGDDSEQWRLVQPESEGLADVWTLINSYLDSATGEEQELATLIEQLRMPPFGIRSGVLPIILATVMRPRMNVMTIRHNGRVVTPITGQTFIQVCNAPDDFTVEMGMWDERRAALWSVLEKHVFSFLTVTEQEQQPLSYLSLGLLRWLQGQPRYNRDTNNVSADAKQLRTLIRKATQDPMQILFHDLLELLEDEVDTNGNEDYETQLSQRLNTLVNEINSSYHNLLYQLDRDAEELFAPDAQPRCRDGQSAMLYWIAQIEQQTNQQIESVRFSDTLTQGFINVLYANIPTGKFWERMGREILDVAPTDWNDTNVESFKQKIIQVQENLPQELSNLSKDEEVIELKINMPDRDKKSYRFRSSDLSPQGQNILANFKTTMAVSGRPLPPDEKRQVALAFVHFMLEGEEGRERKNKSHRVHN